MSSVWVAPELLGSAAADISNIGSGLTNAYAAAAGPTTSLLAAGADEVSAAEASLFSEHGQLFQPLAAEASLFQAQFTQALSQAGLAYTTAELASASPLQALNSLQGLGAQVAGAVPAAAVAGLPSAAPLLDLGLGLGGLNLGGG